MPTYKVTDPQTGKTVSLTGDSPPTEQELGDIFSQVATTQQPTEPAKGKGIDISRTDMMMTVPSMEKLKKFGSDVKKIAGGLPQLITGSDLSTDETRRLPELAEMENVDLKTTLSTGLIQDDDERLAAYKGRGMGARPDYKGNWIVTLPDGREGVLNEPGLSSQDISSGIAQGAIELGVARLVGGAGSTLAKRMLMQAGAEAAKTTLQEAAQVGLGGEFNIEDVIFNMVTAGSVEGAFDLGGSIWRKLSPAARQRYAREKTLDLLLENGISREEIGTLAARAYQDKKIAQALGLSETSIPLPLQSMAVGKTFFELPLAEVMVAASVDPKTSKFVNKALQAQSDGLADSIKKVLANFGSTDAISALKGAKETAAAMLDSVISKRRASAKFAYKDAFEDVNPIETAGLYKKFDEALAVAGADQDAVNRINRARKYLRPDKYEKELSDWRSETAQTSIVSKIRQTPMRGEPPIQTASPWDVHEARVELGDIQEYAKRTNNGKLARIANELQGEIDATLNGATGDKYSVATKRYRKWSERLEAIEESDIGTTAAKKGTRTVGEFAEQIFKPTPLMEQHSKLFIRALKEENPQAAKDLVGAYYSAELRALGPDPKPSEILEKLYGKTNEVVKMVAIADPKTAGNLMRLKQKLKQAAVLEAATSPEKAREIMVASGLDRGPMSVLAEMIGTPGTAMRKFGSQKTKARNLNAVVEAAINPKWSDEFNEIMSLPTRGIENKQKAETFWNKVLAYTVERDARRETAQQAVEYLQQVATDRLNDKEQQQPVGYNIPNINVK